MASGIDVLILAGSRSVADLVASRGERSCKAFVEADGVPMVERVVTTLQASRRFARIVVMLPDDMPLAEESPGLAAQLAAGTVLRASPAPSPATSVEAFLATLPPTRDLMVTTADHPLLTTSMIDEFLSGSERSGAVVTVGIVPLAEVAAAYPETRRTRLIFEDGGYSGCNLFLLRGHAALPVPRFWRRLERHRKHPKRMALSIGLLTVFFFVLRRLTFDQLIARLSRRVGVRLAAIRLSEPEAAIDVDTPDDLALVEEILRARA